MGPHQSHPDGVAIWKQKGQPLRKAAGLLVGVGTSERYQASKRLKNSYHLADVDELFDRRDSW